MRDEDVFVAIRTVFARFAELGRQCRRDRLLAGAESVHGAAKRQGCRWQRILIPPFPGSKSWRPSRPVLVFARLYGFDAQCPRTQARRRQVLASAATCIGLAGCDVENFAARDW